jgi:hypothetical protein
MLKLRDKLMLMLKLQLISGEMDSPQAQLHLYLLSKEKSQILTLSTMVFCLILFLRPTLMLKPRDKLMLMLKKLLINGEMVSPQVHQSH